jgi:dolichol-phosphate mannosyltransferase
LHATVVIPAFNEEDCIAPLLREIVSAAHDLPVREIIVVDDGSADATGRRAMEAGGGHLSIRIIRHGKRQGQSRALLTGIRAAAHDLIVTLDGDGQNDPADIPRLIAERDAPANRNVQLFMGNRKASRKDTAFRKLQSTVANGVRSGLLGDGTPDTGCGIKLFSRELFMELPRFDHMHRFLPALFQRHGARVVSVPVGHRPRTRGTSKYGMLNRLWVGIVDIFGVMWLRRRYKPGLLVREE